MSYYKFEQNDIFTNRIKAHPRTYFLINNSKIYYNNDVLPVLASDASKTIQNSPQGYLSLHEININRVPAEGLVYPFVTKQGSLESFKTVSTEAFQNFQYGNELSGSYPMSASISTEHYAASAARPRATALKNTFNHYKPHSRHYSFETPDWNKVTQEMKLISIPSIFFGSSIKKGSVKMSFYVSGSLIATLEDKARNGELIQTLGPATVGESATGAISFNVSFVSSYNNKRIILQNTSLVSKTFLFDGTNTEGATGTVNSSGQVVVQINGLEGNREGIATQFSAAVDSVSGFLIATSDDLNGSISLTQSTGGLAGNTTIQDPDSITSLSVTNFTGGTTGASNPDIGKVAGVVLYNEGFVALTGSWDISPTHTTETYESTPPTPAAPKWTNWGFYGATHSSWDIDFLGTNYIPTMTMLAHAKQGDLNHSNNPTFIDYADRNDNSEEAPLSPNKFTEDAELKIANVVKSPYANHSGSFEKTTYISKIGIYDEDKNLIGIAKLATPVKKTESRQYTFKLRIDF